MIRLLVTTAIFSVHLGSAAMSAGLDVTVRDVRNARGQVLILVFDDARAFHEIDYKAAVGYAELPAAIGRVTHRFGNLPSGRYAVLVLHDENGDRTVNHTQDRLTEGLGSSGAPNPQDWPDFNTASVPPGKVTIKLHYAE